MATKKTAPKKKATPKTAPAEPKAGRISVRMYRQGLGDCFLITIPKPEGGDFRMLIDCGIVLGADGAQQSMETVVTHLAEKAPHIDVLVVTHEHWDHVSGFSQQKERFAGMTFDNVWVAWTEDPADPLAKKLRGERRAAESALRMAVTRLGLAGESESATHVSSLVSFFGAATGSTDAAMTFAKGLAKSKPRYCKPADPPIVLKELPGVRFWVMGPPKDEKLIKKSNPGKGDAYGLDAGPDGSQAFLMAAMSRDLQALGVRTTGLDDPIQDPFDTGQSIALERAKQLPFFDRRYFGDAPDEGLYEKVAGENGEPEGMVVRDQSWRRIDAAWLGASETMALQLDSATNNTSLVIAIELVESGDVLLFPGDAQAGNWLSWQDLKWTIGEKPNEHTVTGPDLLARTLFYKVGHHGSHNATLKAKGLELMVRDDLVAMVPVNHKMAEKKGWGKMPLPDLMSRLRAKSHGRVLCIDDQVKTNDELAGMKPKDVTDAEWRQFTDRVKVDEWYYEITL
jgi:beta-lactamase superfamily II metal-dependent hydrolase